jgi:uncharacterized protein YlxW (UPF0749 family)
MATAVGEHDGGQLRAVPLTVLLDLGGLEVEARKNILRALKDSHAREMQLREEVQSLRQQLKPEQADVHPLPASA